MAPGMLSNRRPHRSQEIARRFLVLVDGALLLWNAPVFFVAPARVGVE